jgi:hypothetical protein
MPGRTSQIVESLAEDRRVLVLGGLAVIAHGLSRTTEDVDIWLEPLKDVAMWCHGVRTAIAPYDGVYFFDVSQHRKIDPDRLEETVVAVGMVRVGGLDRYLDIFYQPNQLDIEDFETAWNFAMLGLGKARVMDESFLIATKTDTGRTSDHHDVSFLEKKLRREISFQLKICSPAEAERHFSRYLDHATCQAALTNPDAAVQRLGVIGLCELAKDGNPFAIEALKNWEKRS